MVITVKAGNEDLRYRSRVERRYVWDQNGHGWPRMAWGKAIALNKERERGLVIEFAAGDTSRATLYGTRVGSPRVHSGAVQSV